MAIKPATSARTPGDGVWQLSNNHASKLKTSHTHLTTEKPQPTTKSKTYRLSILVSCWEEKKGRISLNLQIGSQDKTSVKETKNIFPYSIIQTVLTKKLVTVELDDQHHEKQKLPTDDPLLKCKYLCAFVLILGTIHLCNHYRGNVLQDFSQLLVLWHQRFAVTTPWS